MVDVPKDATVVYLQHLPETLKEFLKGKNAPEFERPALQLTRTTIHSCVISYKYLPEGDWELVNPLNLVTEEQAKGIMPQHFARGFNSPVYFNHKSGLTKDSFLTALESLNSLATHLGFENANPIVLKLKNK